MLWDKQDRLKPDLAIIIAVAVLLVYGLMAVYSATQSANPIIQNNFGKQFIWMLVGIIVASTIMLIPFKFFYDQAYLFYAVAIFLLILVLIIGGGAGVKRWFYIGPLRLQPSEFAKLATLFALAKYASGQQRDMNNLRDLAIAFLIVLVPTLLIIKEPDLGTALVIMAIVLPVLFWAGLSLFTVFMLLAPLIVMVSAFTFTSFFIAMVTITAVMILSGRGPRVIIPNFLLNIFVGIMTPMLWGNLHAYQRSRILTFLGIEKDPQGLGYQVLQSKVAIGSGGLWGKGWTEGTQTQLRFLPEQHTDFIFSVIGEEFGLFGVIVILLAFLVILWRALNIAADSKNAFAGLVVVGSVVILAFHVLVNSGMTVGIMPVTGLPMPFLSYGGSAMLTNMVIIGLILNAGIRKFNYV